MKKLKAWMAEHKKFSVITLCLLLMFTCGSAMSAINVSHHRAETAKEQHAENNTDTTTAAEKKTKEETGKVELRPSYNGLPCVPAMPDTRSSQARTLAPRGFLPVS